MSEHTAPVTDGEFEAQVLQSDVPVLVDFWAEWCGPCKMVAPVLEEVAEQYKGKLKVLKMDIDNNPEVPTKYGVRSIPTLILFKDGAVEVTKVGIATKSELAGLIEPHLS